MILFLLHTMRKITCYTKIEVGIIKYISNYAVCLDVEANVQQICEFTSFLC